VRVEPLGETGAAMRLAIPMGPLSEAARAWLWRASGITLMLLALSSLAIFFLFRHALNPLSDLTRAMRRLSEGEHAVHLEPGPFLESDQLSRSFDRVGSRFRDLERLWIGEKERLRAILTLSQEAVLLVSQDGQVMFVNDPFRKTFQATLNEGESRPYWELLRSTPLSALIERRLAQPFQPGEEPQALGWEHGGRHFRGRLCPLPEQGAFLVTVSDVTDEMQMSQAKRDLVANVSHELNTPLTSMKGFLETLTDGERDGERLRLLGIVKRNTDRLIAIVKDLLLLSNLDRGPQSLQLETVHPLEILRAVADLYRPSLADKGMELRLDLPAELPALRADPFKLEQVFVNLLDNALKYTDRGQVGLEARHEPGQIEITIWDTGIGINPGLEEKIFERFFTVDKSRSRKAGGTGLGLSIVKHIVLLHGGSITVTRRIEGGTAFRVLLPVS
jgi:two-component system phosphate regulon sensor histidine kinase PhoR